jgi:hypothetical protein
MTDVPDPNRSQKFIVFQITLNNYVTTIPMAPIPAEIRFRNHTFPWQK